MPIGAMTFRDSLRMGTEIFHTLQAIQQQGGQNMVEDRALSLIHISRQVAVVQAARGDPDIGQNESQRNQDAEEMCIRDRSSTVRTSGRRGLRRAPTNSSRRQK